MVGIFRRLAANLTARPLVVTLGACGALFLAGCTAFDGFGAPAYFVSINRPSSQVTIENTANGAMIDVFSDNGIGSATVTLTEGDWPRTMVMRFHLQGLEGLSFAFEETIINLSVTTQQQILQSVSSAGAAEEPIDDGSRFWMPVRFLDREGTAVDVPVAGGVIEVTAPVAFTAGDAPEFTINWIDFYR